MKPYVKKLIKGKVALSSAETAREWYSWYDNRWKSDYPELYANKFKKMPYRRVRRRRRRLTEVTPARVTRGSKRARTSGYASRYDWGPTGGGKAYRFGRSNVGQVVGTGTTKKSQTHLKEGENMITGSLTQYEITDIPAGPQINERERLILNLRGFKIKMYFQATADVPVVINWAILAGRGKNIISKEDIHRTVGTTRSGALDVTSAGFLNAFADINVDEYVVFKHKRFVLSESVVSDTLGPFNTEQVRSSWKMKEFYWPLKRQMRFENQNTSSCVEKIFLVAWVSDPSEAGSVNNQPRTLAKWSQQVVAYYKEPKN